eukprot:scaffold1092_cov303-Pavlova_lutheri.AAC.1
MGGVPNHSSLLRTHGSSCFSRADALDASGSSSSTKPSCAAWRPKGQDIQTSLDVRLRARVGWSSPTPSRALIRTRAVEDVSSSVPDVLCGDRSYEPVGGDAAPGAVCRPDAFSNAPLVGRVSPQGGALVRQGRSSGSFVTPVSPGPSK